MTTPSRYWRVSFRSTDTSSSSVQYVLQLASLRFFSAAGTELSSSLTAGQITLTTGSHYNSTTYPLTNLVDGNATTAWVADYAAGVTNRIQTTYTITFDFGSAVLPDYILARTLSSSLSTTTILNGNQFDFFIDSSSDNVTYLRQAFVYRPMLGHDADYRIPATVASSAYPLPPVANIGGSGGIYGIVSEDGVALPNRPVILLERDSFSRVGYATSDEIGGYAFNGLNEQREFLVMSVDPSGPPYKNALVWDRIKPINTKGNVTSQSAFWARRTREASLGGLVSAREYLDGATANLFAGNILGNTERRSASPDGYNFSPTTAVGGSLKFLKSNRTSNYTGEGIQLYPGMGTPTGQNAASVSANYSALTFEYIVQAPSSGESSLYIVWSGTRDSDDRNMFNRDDLWGYQTAWGAGPTLEITPAGVVNVRFPLGGRNRSTVRATANITPGSVYHVMITYAQDTELKLYINGSLVQTTSIASAGRLWGHLVTDGSATSRINFENWDYYPNATIANAAIRRLMAVCFAGPGLSINNSTAAVLAGGPGYGGGWALAALYYRTFSASDVSTFYDSYANWETHYVSPSQSGYMGEVEADNPNFYVRMNDLVQPSRIASLFGPKDYWYGQYEGAPGYNATGFVSGSTAITTSLGGLRVDRVDVNSIFSIELFCRPTSVSGTQRLMVSRISNGNPPVYLSMVSGVLRLNITDFSAVDTLLQFSQTLVVNTAYHIVVTYDPWYDKQCKLYVNGALVQTITATAVPATGADWFFVGVNGSGTGPTYAERFQGQIGEVALYNYVLPASRIQAHYDARNA